ncbi:Uncharacterized protein APZ42_014056 [Daphnia magna]|uniref:Uncharacterized protein n=1 Tax=Daphnia magna TaxID=35525 RepID=A0A162QAN8_9CRUS|nr:Uncharacterized protein APZ42_014056 [Daphnia magna]
MRCRFWPILTKVGRRDEGGDDYHTLHRTCIRSLFCRKSKRFPRYYGEWVTRPYPIGNFLNGVRAPSDKTFSAILKLSFKFNIFSIHRAFNYITSRGVGESTDDTVYTFFQTLNT